MEGKERRGMRGVNRERGRKNPSSRLRRGKRKGEGLSPHEEKKREERAFLVSSPSRSKTEGERKG